MKIRMIVLSCLIGGLISFFAAELCWPARRTAGKPQGQSNKLISNIGVVNIRRVFANCKRNARYRQEATAERERIEAELEKLAREIEADKAGLKTLKPGSSDYLALMKEVMTKQANLQAQQEFHTQQMELKDKQWTEKLYEDILGAISEVAQQKNLDLVFEKDEVEFPTSSANELMLNIRTNKLLYSGGCLDITDEVVARLDAQENETQSLPDGGQGGGS